MLFVSAVSGFKVVADRCIDPHTCGVDLYADSDKDYFILMLVSAALQWYWSVNPQTDKALKHHHLPTASSSWLI